MKKDITKGFKSGIIILLGTVCLLSSLLIGLNFIISNAKDMQLHIRDTVDDNIKYNITILMDKLTSEANNNVNRVAVKIEDMISNKYPYSNMLNSNLKESLDNDDYTELCKLISPCIKNNYLNDIKTDSNTIFVATNKGIICDYSYIDCPFKKDRKNKKQHYRTWQSYIDNSCNKELAENSVNALINKDTSGIIAYQYKESNDTSNQYSEIDNDKLFDIYKKYGIEGLKGYEILVPTYITENGDIFGKEDIINGVRQDTYKLIIVQRVNVYDQIMANYKSIFEARSESNIIKIESDKVITSMYIIGLVITVIFILYIIQICNTFNKNIELIRAIIMENESDPGDGRR